MHVAKVLPKQVCEFSENRSKIFGKNDLGKKTILVWNKNAYQNGFKLKLSDGVSSVLEAVDFRAASAASASASTNMYLFY